MNWSTYSDTEEKPVWCYKSNQEWNFWLYMETVVWDFNNPNPGKCGSVLKAMYSKRHIFQEKPSTLEQGTVLNLIIFMWNHSHSQGPIGEWLTAHCFGMGISLNKNTWTQDSPLTYRLHRNTTLPSSTFTVSCFSIHTSSVMSGFLTSQHHALKHFILTFALGFLLLLAEELMKSSTYIWLGILSLHVTLF